MTETPISMGFSQEIAQVIFTGLLILPSLNADTIPLKTGLKHCADEASQDRFVGGERCLLHVAATCAKKQVLIAYCSNPNPLLPAVQ